MLFLEFPNPVERVEDPFGVVKAVDGPKILEFQSTKECPKYERVCKRKGQERKAFSVFNYYYYYFICCNIIYYYQKFTIKRKKKRGSGGQRICLHVPGFFWIFLRSVRRALRALLARRSRRAFLGVRFAFWHSRLALYFGLHFDGIFFVLHFISKDLFFIFGLIYFNFHQGAWC